MPLYSSIILWSGILAAFIALMIRLSPDRKWEYDHQKHWECFWFVIIMSGLMSIFLHIILPLIMSDIKHVEKPIQIRAFNDVMGTSSSYVLGTGASSSSLKYNVMKKVKDGWKTQSINADDVTLIFDDQVKFIAIQEWRTYDQWKPWMLLMFVRPARRQTINTTYRLHIPEDKMKVMSQIDMQ